IVAIEDAFAVLGDVEVGETIAVIVADGDSLPEAACAHAGFLSYISESSVAIVVVERVAEGRSGREEIAGTTIDEVQVHPAVVVVVEECAARARRLGEILFGRFAGDVLPGDATGGRKDLLERIGRLRQSSSPARDGSGSGRTENTGEESTARLENVHRTWDRDLHCDRCVAEMIEDIESCGWVNSDSPAECRSEPNSARALSASFGDGWQTPCPLPPCVQSGCRR